MCQLMSGLWVSPGHSPSDPLGLAGTKSTSCGLAALQGPQWLSPRPAGQSGSLGAAARPPRLRVHLCFAHPPSARALGAR